MALIKFNKQLAEDKKDELFGPSGYSEERQAFNEGARWQYEQDQIEMKKLVDVLLLIAHFIPEEDAGYAIVRAQEALEEYYGED